MIQVARSGVRADDDDIALARSEFEARGAVQLRGFLDDELLGLLAESVGGSIWRAAAYEDIGDEDVLEPGPALGLLQFLANWPAFLMFADDVTGCGPYTWFQGRIYRMLPSTHHDLWHDDNVGGRRVGLSVNLSTRQYVGGLFQMRNRLTGAVIEMANTGLGDAILFRVSADFEHRVTSVEAHEPKVAFAGWFNGDAPRLSTRLQNLRTR